MTGDEYRCQPPSKEEPQYRPTPTWFRELIARAVNRKWDR